MAEMNLRPRNIVVVLMLMSLVLCSFGSKAEEVMAEIRAEQWDMPRHGETVMRLPGLKNFLNRWAEKADNIIEIRYPGGEEGELWMRELKDWLIALGVPAKAMLHTPGSGSDDVITLVLIRGNSQHE